MTTDDDQPTGADLAAAVEANGDLRLTAPNGDTVRLHFSQFHGVIVTATRTYIGGDLREVSAYAGDPQTIIDWLDNHRQPDRDTQPTEAALTDEWAVDYSDQVGRNVRDGWAKFGNDRAAAEAFASKALDARLMHRRVSPWAYAARTQPTAEPRTVETDERGAER